MFLVTYLALNLSSAVAVELSEEKLTVIKLMSQIGKYPVKVLENSSSEIKQSIVLVGESHRVNQVRYECAQE